MEEAIYELRDGYEQLHSHLKNRDELSVDYIEETIKHQSRIIENIENSSETRERLKNKKGGHWEDWIDELQSLREQVENLLRDRLQSVDSKLEALDKNLEVMDKYKQDGESNYYLDETI